MPKYKIEIEETLQRVEEIEAETLEDAIQIVENKYNSGEIVLDSNDFKGHETKEYRDNIRENKQYNLYDFIQAREDGIDITDNIYDMMVYFDFCNESKDDFDAYIKSLAKELDVITINNGESVTVNLSEYVKKHFDSFNDLLVLPKDKEEAVEELVCDIMPRIISGDATEKIYKHLLQETQMLEKTTLENEEEEER